MLSEEERQLKENKEKIKAVGRIPTNGMDGIDCCGCCVHRDYHLHKWSGWFEQRLFLCKKHNIVIDRNGWCKEFKPQELKEQNGDNGSPRN